MAEPEMKLTRWQPRQEKLWKDNGDGSTSAQIYTGEGVVEVFTYDGRDPRHAGPFTTLTMFIYPHEYQARLPRHYHDRWLRRLAFQFAWLCSKDATTAH